LSYRPASQADQDLISSFLPRPHADGTPLQPHEFPESLPAYLIRVVPELRVGEEVVASGPVFQMGSELVQNAAYLNAATGSWEAGEDNFPLVGEYIATALDLQGLGASQIDSIKTRLQATAARIEQFQQSPGDPTPVQSLTKEQLVGDVLYGVILSYLAATSQVGRNAARTIGAIAVRMPSFGNFGVSSTPQFQFGIARNVRFRALQMDVDRISQAVVSKNADRAQSIALARMMGFSYSAFEHLVPEMFFTPRDQPGSLPAISAVKALELANQAGQKIYTLNSQNQSIHFQTISQLNIDASVKQELLNALAVGREVTVHQSTLSANGFFGVGYIIFDPETGSGAYKVSGGANGGLIITATLFVAALMTVFGLFFLASTVGVLLFIYGIAFFAMAAFAAYMTDMLDPEIMFVVRHILLVFAITSPFISVPLMVQIFWAIVINALLANIYLFFKNR
jgi:hypothetical protein